MKTKVHFLFVIFVHLIACSGNDSMEENATQKTEDTSSLNTVQNEELHHSVSYDSLSFFVENNKQIPCAYLGNHKDGEIKCPLEENVLIQESENYLILRSMNRSQSMDAYPYYLSSFSKKSGKLLSFIHIGNEAEGVEPNTIKWKSENEFTMIDYQYDFIVDEESGAYMQGEISDSVVSAFVISTNGEITEAGVKK